TCRGKMPRRRRAPAALGLWGLVLLVAVSLGCKDKPAAIAKLTKADGPVERQPGDGSWAVASIGTKYYLGDAARTADGGAELELVGVQTIRMDKYTVLRFGGEAGSAKIAVELGAIELRGTGNFGLDIGDVKLADNGAVRVTAKGQGKSTVELLVGAAQIERASGEMLDLEIGQVIDLDLSIGPIK